MDAATHRFEFLVHNSWDFSGRGPEITERQPHRDEDSELLPVEPGDPCEIGLFSTHDVCVHAASMLRIHGYKTPDSAPARIRDLAFEIAAGADNLFAPSAHYREHAIERCADGILKLTNGVELKCRDFSALGSCDAALAFVLTIGEAVDRRVQEHAEAGELAEALFVETAAWLAIEAATRDFVVSLRINLERRGLGLTRRFAPGYSDWELREQVQLFSLLTGTPLPVRLLDSGAMVPKMSRSGLYGLRRL